MWRIRRFIQPNKPIMICRSRIQRKAVKALSKDCDFIAKIDKGSYGDIIALWSREKERLVVAKVMHPLMTSEGELKLWPRLEHRNVVPLLKLVRRSEVDIFLMPHYSKSLMDVLEESDFHSDSNSFGMTVSWIEDVLTGLEYMHGCDVCHLDLKADNIMITSEDVAAIGDFSTLTSAMDPTDRYALPRYYCPPEAWPLQVDGPPPKVDGRAFDIWSVGMIMFYCFSARWIEPHLWGRTNWWVEIYPLIYKCIAMDFYSSLMYMAFPASILSSVVCSHALNIVKGVLRYVPEERPTPSMILRHALFTKRGKDLLEPDSMWTYKEKDLQRQIIRGLTDLIIRKAVFRIQGILKEDKRIFIDKQGNIKCVKDNTLEQQIQRWLQNLKNCICCKRTK